MDKWQKCPLIENCQQKSAVCNVQLPDETCYWFRWFRALDNPWHTGTPTEEGQLISVHKVCDYLAERADTSKEMGDDGTASLFTSMIGDILAISMGVYNG